MVLFSISGDPSMFHSLYIVVCIPPSQKVNGADIASMGRLATGVKKNVLICSLDKNDQLTYKSLHWSGIS